MVRPQPRTFASVPEFNYEISITAGVGYEGGNTLALPEADIEAIKAYLGIENLTDANAQIWNVTTGEAVDNTTDGWRNAEGDAAGWATSAGQICCKFNIEAAEFWDVMAIDATYGEDDTYTAVWALSANDKTVLLNVNITFVAPVEVEVEADFIGQTSITHYEPANTAYSANTATFNAAEIAAMLGAASLSECEVYLIDANDKLVQNTPAIDWWRDAEGTPALWGTSAGMVCVKINNPDAGEIDYIGCIDETYNEGETYVARFAFVKDGKAVEFDVVINFGDAPVIAELPMDYEYAEGNISVTFTVTPTQEGTVICYGFDDDDEPMGMVEDGTFTVAPAPGQLNEQGIAHFVVWVREYLIDEETYEMILVAENGVEVDLRMPTPEVEVNTAYSEDYSSCVITAVPTQEGTQLLISIDGGEEFMELPEEGYTVAWLESLADEQGICIYNIIVKEVIFDEEYNMTEVAEGFELVHLSKPLPVMEINVAYKYDSSSCVITAVPTEEGTEFVISIDGGEEFMELPAEGYTVAWLESLADEWGVCVYNVIIREVKYDEEYNMEIVCEGFEQVHLSKPLPTFDGDFYVKNVETGLYLNGANAWGTKASVVTTGQLMTIALLENGKYTIDSHISNGGGNHFVGGGDNTFVDSGAAEHEIIDNGDGTFCIMNGGKYFAAVDGIANFVADEITDAARWILLSKEDIIASMAEATAENPVDVSSLIGDANFGRNNQYFDLWIAEEGGKPGKGGANENMNAEKWGGNSQTFNIAQVLTGLPNGLYKLTAQGYYRYNNTNDNTNDVAAAAHADGTEVIYSKLYANEVMVDLKSIADEESVALYGKMPFSQGEASEAFGLGAYQNELEVEVTDGTLKIGVVKGEHIGCDWTVWDNFQLYYLGEVIPEPELTLETKYNFDYSSCFISAEPLYEGDMVAFSFDGVEYQPLPAKGYLLTWDADKADQWGICKYEIYVREVRFDPYLNITVIAETFEEISLGKPSPELVINTVYSEDYSSCVVSAEPTDEGTSLIFSIDGGEEFMELPAEGYTLAWTPGQADQQGICIFNVIVREVRFDEDYNATIVSEGFEQVHLSKPLPTLDINVVYNEEDYSSAKIYVYGSGEEGTCFIYTLDNPEDENAEYQLVEGAIELAWTPGLADEQGICIFNVTIKEVVLSEEGAIVEEICEIFEQVHLSKPMEIEEVADDELPESNILVNGNAAGSYGDMACAWGKEAQGDPHAADIEVVDGTHVFVVHATEKAADPWDNQFWIAAPQKFYEGDKVKVSFRYKASKPATVGTQAHCEPSDYNHWACIGNVNFTTEWQTFEAEITVDGNIQGNNNGVAKGFQSIAFNLNDFAEANDYYFDNLVWEILEEGDAIKNIFADRAAGIYTLAGTKMAKLQKGLNIVVDENGKAAKVMVK